MTEAFGHIFSKNASVESCCCEPGKATHLHGDRTFCLREARLACCFIGLPHAFAGTRQKTTRTHSFRAWHGRDITATGSQERPFHKVNRFTRATVSQEQQSHTSNGTPRKTAISFNSRNIQACKISRKGPMAPFSRCWGITAIASQKRRFIALLRALFDRHTRTEFGTVCIHVLQYRGTQKSADWRRRAVTSTKDAEVMTLV